MPRAAPSTDAMIDLIAVYERAAGPRFWRNLRRPWPATSSKSCASGRDYGHAGASVRTARPRRNRDDVSATICCARNVERRVVRDDAIELGRAEPRAAMPRIPMRSSREMGRGAFRQSGDVCRIVQRVAAAWRCDARGDLADQIDVADIDAGLQRRRATSRFFSRPVLQARLGIEAFSFDRLP